MAGLWQMVFSTAFNPEKADGAADRPQGCMQPEISRKTQWTDARAGTGKDTKVTWKMKIYLSSQIDEFQGESKTAYRMLIRQQRRARYRNCSHLVNEREGKAQELEHILSRDVRKRRTRSYTEFQQKR